MLTGNNSSDLPDSLKCPITHELFRDPVIGADGHTYERENITVWIRKHATSPITRESMGLSSLRSNYTVKKMVEDYMSSSLQKQYEFRLDIDVCKSKPRPIFQSPGKTIYEAQWMLKRGPPIILIKIDGAKAKREASFYVKLSCHPHIVRTYGLVNSNSTDSIMLAQEYAPEGDLSELLRGNNFQPTNEVLLEIFWQIVDAMICLADNQIIHGDLACRNVLVFRSSSDQPSEILVKLTDFGLTRSSPLFTVVDSSASSTLNLIPFRYAAPELLLNASAINYTEKSDVYSFGVLMWEACSRGATPYGDLGINENVINERLKGKLLERPKNISTELWNIIVHCTQHESHNRPNFKAVQEALLKLRFENKQESSKRTSRANSTSKKRTRSPKNLRRSDNQERRSKDGYCERPINISCSDNLDHSSTKNVLSYSRNSNQSPSDYYVPCDYCSQSIDNDDFEMHINVCPVRRIAKSFAKIFVRLPPLEVTSCEYCEVLMPSNMLNIHQDTCTRNPLCLRNSLQISNQSATNSHITSNYLQPIPLEKPSVETDIYEYGTLPDGEMQNPTSPFVIQPEISNRSSVEHLPISMKVTKPPKTGLRKVLSKLKKKTS